MSGYPSGIAALDEFFRVIRARADADQQFQAALIQALGLPVRISIEVAADVTANISFLDPVAIAGRGVDEFRAVFAKLKDAEIKKVLKHYNLTSADNLKGKGAPKGEALLELLWDAARSRRGRYEA